jgi:hypothetical protein
MRTSYLGLVLLATVLPTSCGHQRAYGIPGATQRSPDLAIPLSKPDLDRALLVLDNQTPPRGGWPAEEAAELLANVAAETKQTYVPLLDALTSTVSALELEGGGRVGGMLDSKGANEEALDARFKGDILTGDLRVGKKGDYLFVFYRRYPFKSKDHACPRAREQDTYCRLVIVKEVATRRD